MFRADRGIKRQGVAAYALRPSTSGCGTSWARRLGCRSSSSGAPSPTACRRTAAAAGATTATEDVDRGGPALRRARLPLLQDEGPPPRPAGEPRAGGGGEQALGDGVRLMVDVNQRLDVLGNIRQAAAARGPRPRLVRGAGARRRHRGVRRGRPLDPHPGRDRREQLLALRVPRADRAARRALPDARRLPRQRLQRDAEDRRASPPRTRCSSHPTSSTSCRCKSSAPRQRLPGRVHGLGAGGSVRRACRRARTAQFRIPDRPGHGIALAPGAVEKYRPGKRSPPADSASRNHDREPAPGERGEIELVEGE